MNTPYQMTIDECIALAEARPPLDEQAVSELQQLGSELEQPIDDGHYAHVEERYGPEMRRKVEVADRLESMFDALVEAVRRVKDSD